MMKYLSYIMILFGFWLLFTFNLSPINLILGISVTTITVLVLGKYFVESTSKLLQPRRYFWFVIYIFIFAWECLKANLDVAYRVIHPAMPIRPGIVKVKTNLKTNIGKTTLANSITMTPGTLTVDIVNNYLYIHWIYVQSTDPEKYTEKISGRFERYIIKIFE